MKQHFDPFEFPKGHSPKYYPITNSVLFVDFKESSSKSLTNIEMKQIVTITDAINDMLWNDFNWNEKGKKNDLILMPSGDGYGIAFHPSFKNEIVLDFATSIFRLIHSKEISFSMGIAKGPNIRYMDTNETMNLFGYGVALAQRIAYLASNHQILVHEDFAKEMLMFKTLKKLRAVREPLEGKHGELIKVYNYFLTDKDEEEN